MGYCAICGDDQKLSPVLRFWSPDDGWVAGRLCPYCKKDFGKRKPKKEDYAYDQRKALFSDEDAAIVTICG